MATEEQTKEIVKIVDGVYLKGSDAHKRMVKRITRLVDSAVANERNKSGLMRHYLGMFVKGRGQTETPPSKIIAEVWDWLQDLS